METAFYLKYRPQKFVDLDCTSAREELIKIFSSEKIPHAFLLTGTKGIGKTSGARIIAKSINCERKTKDDFEPCGKCSSCLSITNGSNLDVIEIDAASNRNIDDIRDLRDKIRLSPTASKYKVYIIDEVHMLTNEAFNALLKTLEEPPKHAIFVLCTTDPEKMPKTILSRCQRINFRKANQKETVDKLKKICEFENLKFEEDALVQIYKIAEGSYRDAVKTLEQVSFEKEITLVNVNKIIGILGEFKVVDFLLLLQDKNTKDALEFIGKMSEQGGNLKIFLENLLSFLRSFLLSFFIEQEENFKDFSISLSELKILITLFSKAYSEMKYAVISQLPLEMAIIEWGNNIPRVGKEADKKKIEEKLSGSEEKVPEIINDVQNIPVAKLALDEVEKKWTEILEKVKPFNHSVSAVLKSCRLINCDDGYLVLEVYYKFHKDQLETDKCRKIFEMVAGGVLSCPVRLKCILGEGKKNLEPKPLPEIEFPINVSTKPGEIDIIKVASEIFNN